MLDNGQSREFTAGTWKAGSVSGSPFPGALRVRAVSVLGYPDSNILLPKIPGAVSPAFGSAKGGRTIL